MLVMRQLWASVVLVVSVWLVTLLAGGLHFHADVRQQHVNVRWAPFVPDDTRLKLEQQFGLIDAERSPNRTWSYLLTDHSRTNISALVHHPSVEDTAHIDRSTFRIQLDRPDLPRWAVRLAETGHLDTVALVLASVALIVTWSLRSSLRQAWLILIGDIPPRFLGAAIAIVGGLLYHNLWLGFPLRGIGLGLTAAGVFLLCAARLARVDDLCAFVDARPLGRRTGAVALAGVALAIAAMFCWPLLSQLGALGVDDDWDQHLTLHWVPYHTVRQYGQLPLWNPYVCGGMPMLGNPQSRWLTPFFFLHVLHGPELALQLEIIGHIGIAWLGAFLLGRTAGLSRIASLMPATIFAGASYLYLHLAAGHTTWVAYAYIPGILAASASNRPFIAGVGLALAFFEGGVYAVPHTVLVLVALAALGSVTQRSVHPIAQLGATGITAACIAAPKLLLMLALIARYPRIVDSTETLGLELVARALLEPGQDLQTSVGGSYPQDFHEYGAYVGPIPLVLAAYGVFSTRGRAIPWVVLFGGGLVLSLGGLLGGEYSPWGLLHRLPILESLRVPSRFLWLPVLALGMLAGLGVERLLAPRIRWRTAIALALLVTASIDVALVGPPNLRHLSDGPRTEIGRSETFIQLHADNDRQMYATARAHMGSLNCYEPLEPVVAPVGVNESGYRGEQYLLQGGTARLVEWSPNRLTIAVSSNSPNVLVINYNYDPFWRVASGRGQAFEHQGLLGVSVPAESQELVLAYDTQRFTVGILLALAALIVAAWSTTRR